MNERLSSLVRIGARRLGVLPDGSWGNVVLRTATGSISPLPTSQSRQQSNPRGFHLEIHDQQGEPQLFCKVRQSLPDQQPRRDTQVLQGLGGFTSTRKIIPNTTNVRDAVLDIQLFEFLKGPSLGDALQGVGGKGAQTLLQGAVQTNRTLTAAIEPGSPLLCGVAAPWPEKLDTQGLYNLGLSQGATQTLEKALLRSPTVEPRPQHGDFWPPNLFPGADGSFRIIDFDEFAETAVPLFDVFHLLRSSFKIREPGKGWIEGIMAKRLSPELRLDQALLRESADHLGLDEAQVGYCFIHFLGFVVVLTASRGGPPSFWQEDLTDLEFVLSGLDAQTELPRLGGRIVGS